MSLKEFFKIIVLDFLVRQVNNSVMEKDVVDIPKPHDNIFLRVLDAADEWCELQAARFDNWLMSHETMAVFVGELDSAMERAALRPPNLVERVLDRVMSKIFTLDFIDEVQQRANQEREAQRQRRIARRGH